MWSCDKIEKVSPSKVGPVLFLLSQACLLSAGFPPGDTIAGQHNDWEFSYTLGFNCGKGQVEVEVERRDRESGVLQPVTEIQK